MNILRVFQLGGAGWHFSLDGSLTPDRLSRLGVDTRKGATIAGINAGLVRNEKITYATGDVDRKTCSNAGIPYRGLNSAAATPDEVSAPAPPPTKPLSEAKLRALEAARARRAIAAERKTPDGFRSIDHFLDSVRETVNSRSDGVASLARYLNVSPRAVRSWINREKLPMQDKIDGMALWRAARAKTKA